LSCANQVDSFTETSGNAVGKGEKGWKSTTFSSLPWRSFLWWIISELLLINLNQEVILSIEARSFSVQCWNIHHTLALLNTLALTPLRRPLVLMSSIYLIDVVIDSSENYLKSIIRKSQNALLSLSDEAGNFLPIFFAMNRKLFMVRNFCGKIVFLSLHWMRISFGYCQRDSQSFS
jgi:hypothetical protein